MRRAPCHVVRGGRSSGLEAQKTIRGDIGWGRYGLAVLRLVAVPMVLHGLYDTILKKDLDELC